MPNEPAVDHECHDADGAYFSLIDPKASDLSHATITDHPYLYYVRMDDNHGPYQRILFRQRVKLDWLIQTAATHQGRDNNCTDLAPRHRGSSRLRGTAQRGDEMGARLRQREPAGRECVAIQEKSRERCKPSSRS